MIVMVVLCPKMKAPTTMVMTPQTVKMHLQKRKIRDVNRNNSAGYWAILYVFCFTVINNH